jgi:hypothetical protein
MRLSRAPLRHMQVLRRVNLTSTGNCILLYTDTPMIVTCGISYSVPTKEPKGYSAFVPRWILVKVSVYTHRLQNAILQRVSQADTRR